jgi:AbrB family looped-hinge helix DNA binding protein
MRGAYHTERGFCLSGRALIRSADIASTPLSLYDKPIDMSIVTISPKFQVVIPQSVREALHLAPGEKLRVFHHSNRVEFIPVRPIQEMRGFLKNMDTTIERDGDRL